MLPGQFQAYLDSTGLLTPGEPTQNGLRYTSDAVVGCFLRGIPISPQEFRTLIQSCMPVPGLLQRSPHGGLQEGPDDYIAVLSACRLICPDVAQEIYQYGLENQFFYRNGKPDGADLSPFLGRFPAFWAHIKWCAGLSPKNWEKALWVGSVLYTGLRAGRGQDDWVLSAHLLAACPDNDWAVRIAKGYWRMRFRQAWPGGFRQLLKAYFGFEHPLVALWDGLDERL